MKYISYLYGDVITDEYKWYRYNWLNNYLDNDLFAKLYSENYNITIAFRYENIKDEKYVNKVSQKVQINSSSYSFIDTVK